MKLSSAKIAIAALSLLAVGYGVAEFRGPNGYSGLLERRRELRELQTENSRLRAEIDRLDRRVEKLKNDPAAQELEIRKRLHMVKAGETVYVLQDGGKASTAK